MHRKRCVSSSKLPLLKSSYGRAATRRDIADDPQRVRLVASLASFTREFQGRLGGPQRLVLGAEAKLVSADQHNTSGPKKRAAPETSADVTISP